MIEKVIPSFDVTICRDYEIVSLRAYLSTEDVVHGFTEHHEYECIGLPSWRDVTDCLKEESSVLERAARSTARDGIQEIIDAIDDDDGVELAEFMMAFHGLDVGVAGLSLALSAARAATFYSCSSGIDSYHHAEYPMVGVVPGIERAKLIAEMAERADCGIGQERERWYIYARSVSAMHALAQLVLAQREAFDALPEPGWVCGLAEQLEHFDGS